MIADFVQLQVFLSLVFEIMGKGVYVHTTRIFPKQVSPDLLGLEKTPFFKLPKTLETQKVTNLKLKNKKLHFELLTRWLNFYFFAFELLTWG